MPMGWGSMTDERLDIIIKEITYWKQNKLLPEHYCDYLLALYTKGDVTMLESNHSNLKTPKITQILRVVLMILMLLLSFFLIYFIEIQGVYQTILLAIIAGFANWMFMLLKENRNFFFHIGIVILLAIYFISSIHIGTLYTKNKWVVYLILFINIFSWLHISQKLKLKYLKLVSIISTIITVFYVISRYFVS